jgi:predicted DNA-binding mobile mystery protein A
VRHSTEMRRMRGQMLEERLRPWRELKSQPRPRKGWIATIRESLGMGVSQLAARMGVSPAAVTQLERREVDGKMTLESLSRAAAAMDSTLVYGIVPNASLEEIVKRQAEKVARAHVQRVSHTMKLEAQDVDSEESTQQESSLVQRLLSERPPALWDDDDRRRSSRRRN